MKRIKINIKEEVNRDKQSFEAVAKVEKVSDTDAPYYIYKLNSHDSNPELPLFLFTYQHLRQK